MEWICVGLGKTTYPHVIEGGPASIMPSLLLETGGDIHSHLGTIPRQWHLPQPDPPTPDLVRRIANTSLVDRCLYVLRTRFDLSSLRNTDGSWRIPYSLVQQLVVRGASSFQFCSQYQNGFLCGSGSKEVSGNVFSSSAFRNKDTELASYFAIFNGFTGFVLSRNRCFYDAFLTHAGSPKPCCISFLSCPHNNKNSGGAESIDIDFGGTAIAGRRKRVSTRISPQDFQYRASRSKQDIDWNMLSNNYVASYEYANVNTREGGVLHIGKLGRGLTCDTLFSYNLDPNPECAGQQFLYTPKMYGTYDYKPGNAFDDLSIRYLRRPLFISIERSANRGGRFVVFNPRCGHLWVLQSSLANSTCLFRALHISSFINVAVRNFASATGAFRVGDSYGVLLDSNACRYVLEPKSNDPSSGEYLIRIFARYRFLPNMRQDLTSPQDLALSKPIVVEIVIDTESAGFRELPATDFMGKVASPYNSVLSDIRVYDGFATGTEVTIQRWHEWDAFAFFAEIVLSNAAWLDAKDAREWSKTSSEPVKMERFTGDIATNYQTLDFIQPSVDLQTETLYTPTGACLFSHRETCRKTQKTKKENTCVSELSLTKRIQSVVCNMQSHEVATVRMLFDLNLASPRCAMVYLLGAQYCRVPSNRPSVIAQVDLLAWWNEEEEKAAVDAMRTT